MAREDYSLYIANLDFLLNYDDGRSNDEIEYELFRIAFQMKETIHYDRAMGGSFQYFEQERTSEVDVLRLKFSSSMIESVYRNNEKKSFDPFIILGAADIETKLSGTSYLVTMYYRLLDDIKTIGALKLEV